MRCFLRVSVFSLEVFFVGADEQANEMSSVGCCRCSRYYTARGSSYSGGVTDGQRIRHSSPNRQLVSLCFGWWQGLKSWPWPWSDRMWLHSGLTDRDLRVTDGSIWFVKRSGSRFEERFARLSFAIRTFYAILVGWYTYYMFSNVYSDINSWIHVVFAKTR